ncbi:AN1-type zinc finger protein 2A-like [Xenia sp. Carnegie-2017]|uniref:AN1-type zinc finger protein 2A-like n=1 Tax=Xenia sp. Carnegie-2017 TaxID=2897299 RepID=UPI001F036B4C|nr:AN1-type zinc finger protein 2A-like [Xenia sp. Carnegie-2017]
MEFPGLGKHCSLASCKRLDFLPMNCDACNKTFCSEHISYNTHNCQSAYKKDVQVPVCPLCNKPIPVKRGEPPDIKVGEHIDRDCLSDPAKENRKLNANRCSAKGCKKRELVPITCPSCRRNYCLRHRHPQDHNCTTAKSTNYLKLKNTNTKFDGGSQNVLKNKPQQTPLSVLGRDLDRLRRERAGQQNVQRSNDKQQQSTLTEDEALALAIQASLSASSTSPTLKNKFSSTLEEEDHALAKAIADSEKEERERRRRQQSAQQSSQNGENSSCTVS